MFTITGDHLVKIFQDKKFLEKLILANETEELEVAFEVEQAALNPEYCIKTPAIGGWESMKDEVKIDDEDEKTRIYHPHVYTLIDLHTHPGGTIAPSGWGADLRVHYENNYESIKFNGIRAKPISIISVPKGKKSSKLLLIQDLSDKLLPDFVFEEKLGEYENLDYSAKDSEIISSLKETGLYKVELINFNGNSYSKESLRKIKSFAFTPKITNKTFFDSLFFE